MQTESNKRQFAQRLLQNAVEGARSYFRDSPDFLAYSNVVSKFDPVASRPEEAREIVQKAYLWAANLKPFADQLAGARRKTRRDKLSELRQKSRRLYSAAAQFAVAFPHDAVG
jgi:hypothetical protein